MTRREDEMRHEYRRLFAVAIVLALLGIAVVAAIFGAGSTNTDERLKALQLALDAATVLNAAQNAQITELQMTTVSYTTTYAQNGTCLLGFPKVSGSSAQVPADFSDYVTVAYSLLEIQFTPLGLPATFLQIGTTPRPIVFNGYTPAASLPRQNELSLELTQCDPPISQLDAIAQSAIGLVPYTKTTAAKIQLTPDCVATTLADQNSAHCTPEEGYSPFFSASFPSENSVSVFTNNAGVPGDAVLQFFWGQWSYVSIPGQYDFTGTTVAFTAPLMLQLVSL